MADHDPIPYAVGVWAKHSDRQVGSPLVQGFQQHNPTNTDFRRRLGGLDFSGWILIAVGAVLALFAVNLAIVRPLAARVDQLQVRVVNLSSSVEKLVAELRQVLAEKEVQEQLDLENPHAEGAFDLTGVTAHIATGIERQHTFMAQWRSQQQLP